MAESRRTNDHILLSVETPPTWRARSPYLGPSRNRVAQLYSQVLDSLFVASYYSQGYGEGILIRLHSAKYTYFYVHILHSATI
jgi:hypothetical protein